MTEDHPGEVRISADTTTRMNVATFVSVVGAVIVATFYMSGIINQVDRLDVTVRDVRATLEKIDDKIDLDHRTITELKMQVRAIEERCRTLQERVVTLENDGK